MSRRSMLVTGAAAAGLATLGLAGCGSPPAQPPSAATGPPAQSPPAQSPSAATGAAPPAQSAPGSSVAAEARPAAPAKSALVGLSSIPVGGSVSATGAGGQKLIITRTGGASAVAHSAICTHMGCTVAPADAQLNCPCHGSVFNAATGAVVHGPARSPLPAVAVTVANGQVVQS